MSENIAHMVDDHRGFARLISHTPHRLLDVQRQAFGGPQQDCRPTVRDIESLADQIDIAEHSDLSLSELFNNPFPLTPVC